jgi:hypothetical protein
MARTDAIVIVHEPSGRFVGAGLVLVADPRLAVHVNDEAEARALLARHASEPCFRLVDAAESAAA